MPSASRCCSWEVGMDDEWKERPTDRVMGQSRDHIDQRSSESGNCDIDDNQTPLPNSTPFTMLSNPPHMSPGGLHSRQRQHRRQNSTPSVYEAVKIAPLPNFQHQRPNVSHRRGLSLDTRRQQLATSTHTTPRQNYTPVGIPTTNPGSATTPQQTLREAQQQRTIRRGSDQPAFTHFPTQHLQDDSDSFLLSPQVTPQSQRFINALSGQGQMAETNGLSFETYLALDMMKSPTSFSNNGPIDPSQDFNFYGSGSALSTPTFMTFPESSPASTCQGWISESETASTQSRRASRRISNGIMDKIAKFESLGSGIDTPSQRPTTPANQNLDGMHDRPGLRCCDGMLTSAQTVSLRPQSSLPMSG